MSEPNSPFPSIPPPPGPPSFGTPSLPVPPPSNGPRPFPASSAPYGGTGPGPAGPSGFGPSGFGPGGFGNRPTRSGLAVAALVLGLITVLLFWTVVVPVLAVVFGLIAARSIKASRGQLTGLKMARAGWILGVVGLLGFAAVVVAVVVSERDDDDIALDDLEIGACYDLPATDEVLELSSLDAVPCDEPHRGELFHQYDMNPDRDRTYPGQSGAFDEAGEVCTGEAWTDYVGLEYQQSVFEVYVVIPDDLSWKLSRGEASCFVVDAGDGLLTEVAAGSER